MTEAYVSLRGKDAEKFEQFRDRLEKELPGGVESNKQAILAAIDLAQSEGSLGN